ncbi:hypothetical protein QAD02_014808 [Eretmocerus hayati]|uniref:Uncharacterized protein n=1 Tax=Eretmocerus hayati TaxID=131215 RepID=A0ACC2P7M6_9HYME|nr:hypothetical protein QAD02_014808 [Eretmocerus hayati]
MSEMNTEHTQSQIWGSRRILSNIFQHLTVKDLCSISCVCRLWNDISKEKSLRQKAFQTVIVPIICSKTFRYNKHRKYDIYPSLLEKAHLASCLEFVPQICLLFKDEKFPLSAGGCKTEEIDYKHYQRQLPMDAICLYIATTSLIFDSWTIGGDSNTAIATFLQSIPGISVQYCSISYDDVRDFYNNGSVRAKVDEVLIPKDDEFSCLVLLLSKECKLRGTSDFTKRIFNNIKKGFDPDKCCLWGGDVSYLSETRLDDPNIFCIGMKLSGPRLRVCTCAIKKGLSLDDYEMILRRIKQEIPSKCQTVGFFIASIEADDESFFTGSALDEHGDLVDLCENIFPHFKFSYLFQADARVFSDYQIGTDSEPEFQYTNCIAIMFLSYGQNITIDSVSSFDSDDYSHY